MQLSQTIGILAMASLLGLGGEHGVHAQSAAEAISPTTYVATPTVDGDAIESATGAPLSAEQTREIEIIRQLARHRGGQPEALAQIVQLASPWDDGIAAELLEELAVAHLRAGDLNLAAEARFHLAQRYPNEPLATRSILWLVRLYASSEVTHAQRGDSPGMVALRQQLSPRMAAAMSEKPSSIEGGPAMGASPSKAGERLSLYALHLATRAMGSQAALANDPELAFQRSVAARRAGQVKSSQAFLSPLKHRDPTDPWGQCARTEEWLEQRGDEAAPIPIVPCVVATSPPHLNGQLDDACWQTAGKQLSRMSIDEGADSLPADVRLSYDEKYLYLAVRCPKLAKLSYQPDNRPRPHDGDVEAHDRVRLLIDVDRDYASWFELVVDSRGWTADRCWGDAAWNPRWFVARGEAADGAAWVVEAAVPLSELAAAAPVAGSAWACAATRLPPNQPAEDSPSPAAFSLLLFE